MVEVEVFDSQVEWLADSRHSHKAGGRLDEWGRVEVRNGARIISKPRPSRIGPALKPRPPPTFVREAECADPAKLQQVCTQIGRLHYLDTLAEHGDQIARDSLQKNPAKFIPLFNACCNASNANIAIEKAKWRKADLPSRPPAPSEQATSSLESCPNPSIH